jgi:hypothetical protein
VTYVDPLRQVSLDLPLRWITDSTHSRPNVLCIVPWDRADVADASLGRLTAHHLIAWRSA